MYSRNRIPSSSRPTQAWQESVVRDRGGEGSSSAQSRAFPSASLSSRPFPSRPPAARPSASNPSASRPPASRPPASHPPASHPFASPLPASNPFAPRPFASRRLAAPADGSSDEFFTASSSLNSESRLSSGASAYGRDDNSVLEGLRNELADVSLDNDYDGYGGGGQIHDIGRHTEPDYNYRPYDTYW